MLNPGYGPSIFLKTMLFGKRTSGDWLFSVNNIYSEIVTGYVVNSYL